MNMTRGASALLVLFFCYFEFRVFTYIHSGIGNYNISYVNKLCNRVKESNTWQLVIIKLLF